MNADDVDLSTVQLAPIDGGFRVRTIDAQVHLDVLQQIFNWRLCETPVTAPLYIRRSWCYQGADIGGFLSAVLAAAAWDWAPDSDPQGWIKNNQTGEYRTPDPDQD